MLSVYDLYDLHAIYTGIRFLPSNEINEAIVQKTILVLKNRHLTCVSNPFRIALRPICVLDKNELYKFALIDNKYSYFPLPFLKNEKIYLVLIKACEELLSSIREKNEERTYDLADCLHNLPIVLTENNYSIPKQYWKNEISYYRSKWNKDFLVCEQAILKK